MTLLVALLATTSAAQAAPPANDNFADATPIPASELFVDLDAATAEAGEPGHEFSSRSARSGTRSRRQARRHRA